MKLLWFAVAVSVLFVVGLVENVYTEVLTQEAELAYYKQRVLILFQFIQKTCPGWLPSIPTEILLRGKRADGLPVGLQLSLEKLHYNQLTKDLIECSKGDTDSKATSSKSPATTPTTIPSTIPTILPTTTSATTPTTITTMATTTPTTTPTALATKEVILRCSSAYVLPENGDVSRYEIYGRESISYVDTKVLSQLGLPWFRSSNGSTLRNTCPNGFYSCGSDYGIYSTTQPKHMVVGVVKSFVAYAFGIAGHENCMHKEVPLESMMCPDGSIVYSLNKKYEVTKWTYEAFCGMKPT